MWQLPASTATETSPDPVEDASTSHGVPQSLREKCTREYLFRTVLNAAYCVIIYRFKTCQKHSKTCTITQSFKVRFFQLSLFEKSHPRKAAALSSCSRCMAAATPSPRLTGGAMRRRNLRVRLTTWQDFQPLHSILPFSCHKLL